MIPKFTDFHKQIIDEFGSFFGNIDVNTHNLYEEFQTFRVLAEALRMALSDKAPGEYESILSFQALQ